MPKVSPIVRSMNGGEVSPLMDGRTDLDRYPSSCRRLFNTIAAPQGPAIPRSGTAFSNPAYKADKRSTLIPFVFSEDDFYLLEFADQRIRFHNDDGALAYAAVACAIVTTVPFVISSAGLAANVGDEVALTGFPSSYNINGQLIKITAKVGINYTLDYVFPALPSVGGLSVSRIYHIASPYAYDETESLRYEQSLDVLYLVNGAVAQHKLQRIDTYNWTIGEVGLSDGPYMPVNETKTVLSINTTGRATPDMSANNAPSGLCTGSSVAAGRDFFHAFDPPSSGSFWQSNTNQLGHIQYQFPAAVIVDGYSIVVPANDTDANYSSKDYAPSNFTLSGSNDGVTFTALDTQNTYVLYDGNKSVFFNIPNVTAYIYYRLTVESLVRNGPIAPRIRSLVLRTTTSTTLTITASDVVGINNGQGFLPTDVGRLLRMKGVDGYWRPLKITARASATQVTATLLGEPFPTLNSIKEWRLGAWSDTTGYPNEVLLYQDRLWFFGSDADPDFFASSNTGSYENMAPTTPSGEVLDTNGISGRLNSRRQSRVKWAAGLKDGLAVATGSQEFLLRMPSGSGKTLVPTGDLRADPISSRGSADVAPVVVDNQVLFVQRSGRTLRELSYSYEIDNYKTVNMSLLSSHIGVPPFVEMVYAAEPHSLAFLRRSDGSIAGLTYNREENTVGWHRHDVSGVVESMAVTPSSDKRNDTLWLSVVRTVNGSEVRYIEKLMPFWDFDSVLDDAFYVDCGLKYDGAATSVIYGLSHLEGEEVYGVADGIPFGPLPVIDGAITFGGGIEVSKAVVGLGLEAEGETMRLENGAADGTAMGKLGRIFNVSVMLWASCTGEIGVWNDEDKEVKYTEIEYPGGEYSELEEYELFTGILGPFTMAPGLEKNGSVSFRRRKDKPLPFNILAFMPQMEKHDRG